MAKGRARTAIDRCSGGARHSSGRRRPGLLASRSQSLVCERDAAAVHPSAPSGLVAPAKDYAMRDRFATIVTTFGAVALVMSAMGEAKPTYIWNASKSVSI